MRAGVLTPAEARADPAHRPWFALVEAVEAARRQPGRRSKAAVGRASEILQRALRAPGEARP